MGLPHFLFDEDVTVQLVPAVVERGHFRSRHVNDARLSGCDDIAVLDYAVEHELALVTENGRDFRRLLWLDESHPGRHLLHPGLVILEDGSLLAEQEVEWFMAFLDHVAEREDLINRIFELHAPNDIREFERPPF